MSDDLVQRPAEGRNGDAVDRLYAVAAVIISVADHLAFIVQGIAPIVIVIIQLLALIGIFGKEIHMIGLAMMLGIARLEHLKFIAIEDQKVRVAQMMLRNQDLMVRKSHDLISLLFISLFQLLRSPCSVGHGAVGMQIRLKILSHFR